MCIDLTTLLGYVPTFSSVGSVSLAAIEILSPGTAGDTLRIGSVELTAVAGARVSGSATWSVDGAIEVEAASLLAAIADSDASALVSGSRVGAVVNLTTISTGPASILDLETSDAAVYSLTPFTGGEDYLELMLTATCRTCDSGLAHAYRTAHFVEVDRGNERGVMTNRSMNKISHGLSAPSFDASDAAYATTKYGRMYLALKQEQIVLPMSTGITNWNPTRR